MPRGLAANNPLIIDCSENNGRGYECFLWKSAI